MSDATTPNESIDIDASFLCEMPVENIAQYLLSLKEDSVFQFMCELVYKLGIWTLIDSTSPESSRRGFCLLSVVEQARKR